MPSPIFVSSQKSIKTMHRRSCKRASRSGYSYSSLSLEALLIFMLTAVSVSVMLRNSISTPGPRLPLVVTSSILLCFIACLISQALRPRHQYRGASRLFLLFGFHAILLTLASLLSTILPPSLSLLPYILVSLFVFCNFFPFKWLYRRGREVGAFTFFICRSTSACETPSPLSPPPPRVTNV